MRLVTPSQTTAHAERRAQLAAALIGGTSASGEQILVGCWRSRLARVLPTFNVRELTETMSSWLLRIPDDHGRLARVDRQVRASLTRGQDGLPELRAYTKDVKTDFPTAYDLSTQTEVIAHAVDHYIGCAIATLTEPHEGEGDAGMAIWHAGLIGASCLTIADNYILEYERQIDDLASVLVGTQRLFKPLDWPSPNGPTQPDLAWIAAALGDPQARQRHDIADATFGSHQQRLSDLLARAEPRDAVRWACQQILSVRDLISAHLREIPILPRALESITNCASGVTSIGNFAAFADEFSTSVATMDDGSDELSVSVHRALHFGDAMSACLAAIGALSNKEHRDAAECAALVATELAKAAPSELAEVKRQLRSLWAR